MNATTLGSLLPLVFFAVLMILMIAIPQRRETKAKNAMFASMAVGDTILTTSGFYGVLIDIQDDTVIVEFGSNKNCRIPMQKAAIAAVEKPEDAVTSKEEK